MTDIFCELLIVALVIVLANIIFNKFEKHLSIGRRFTKHGILFIVILLIRIFLGRTVFLIVLGALTLGQIILHAWWFPKNGINGLTAEPYQDYLNLIRKKKK